MKKDIIKKNYLTPNLERVLLDQEISLTLDSSTTPFTDPVLTAPLMDSPVMGTDPVLLGL
jgi:hypothetical protein